MCFLLFTEENLTTRASKGGLTVIGALYRQAMTTIENMDTVEVLSLTYAKKRPSNPLLQCSQGLTLGTRLGADRKGSNRNIVVRGTYLNMHPLKFHFWVKSC